jgi:formylglycine-generating enzyme required for sulfatase activity
MKVLAAILFILSSAAGEVAWSQSAPAPPPEGMVWIPGGEFWMGSDEGQSDERPVHQVRLEDFFLDETEVTNAEFAKFVEATGYVTVAERKPDPKDFPGVPEEALVPGGVVYKRPSGPVTLRNHLNWWEYVPGAQWRHPLGPDSDIEGKQDHPVVQVCWEDAVAYCEWAGKRLPTEAEWEYAARGGLDRKPYVWGEEKVPEGTWMMNIWQGNFPLNNELADGFEDTAPVKSYPPNGLGLYDMAGNVWEWCSDWYRPDTYTEAPRENPQGPETSFDPREPGVPKKVSRGGSFLCSDNYCIGYRPSARMKNTIDTGLCHTGFRCAKSPETN